MTQDWSLAPAAPPPAPKGKGLIVSGLVLLVVAVVLVGAGIASTVGAASKLLGSLDTASTTPATIVVSMDAGQRSAVYAEGSPDGTGGGTVVVAASDVTVTGPAGAVPVAGLDNLDETFTDSGATFVAVATFTAPTTGQYTVSVGGSGSRVIVAPDMISIGTSFVGALLIPVGLLFGVVGLVLLIVGLVRRSSSRKALAAVAYPGGYPGAYPGGYGATTPAGYPTAPPPGAPLPPPVAPPAGWFPDPERPGGQRYWDGTAWTEHRV